MKLKFENVDIEKCLRSVMERNTQHYQGDFEFDVKSFRHIAQSLFPERKPLYWLSRPSGTWCFQDGELQKQIVNYSKTRAVYIEYRKAGYSKKFRAEHEADILIHQAAKKYFDGLGVQKLPTVKALREEYSEVLAAKRKAYAEYKQARAKMRELQNVKANIDYLLGPSTGKDNTRQRQ